MLRTQGLRIHSPEVFSEDSPWSPLEGVAADIGQLRSLQGYLNSMQKGEKLRRASLHCDIVALRERLIQDPRGKDMPKPPHTLSMLDTLQDRKENIDQQIWAFNIAQKSEAST